MNLCWYQVEHVAKLASVLRNKTHVTDKHIRDLREVQSVKSTFFSHVFIYVCVYLCLPARETTNGNLP